MSRHIILIDDDQEDAQIFSDALVELQNGFTVSHFDDGIAALNTLRTDSTIEADIIFLDINMPKIDGWQCLREIKNIALLKHIPIVMYSTTNLAMGNLAPDTVGAAAFLTKPDNFQELKEKLRSLFSTLM